MPNFYFAHDLHHIRLQRQYELTGDEDALLEAKNGSRLKWNCLKKQMLDM